MTLEPFQPVRLYYSIPSISAVESKLRSLKCMSEVPDQNCWEWILEAEAASLRFGVGGYDDVPPARRPIVIGRVRFPSSREMTLQTNSIDRAIEGARFFGPRLGPKVEALRVRVVNLFFAAEEGTPDEFVTMLDRDVTVIDPRLIEGGPLRTLDGYGRVVLRPRGALFRRTEPLGSSLVGRLLSHVWRGRSVKHFS